MGSIPRAIGAAPWDAVAPEEQLFVLITGANSGIGLGIGQRLIDEFLATRSLAAHLILVPTTRSAAKSLQTIQALRGYAAEAARRCPRTAAAAEATVRRIHVLSPQLDLCDLRGVHGFAARLVHGTLSNPEGLEHEYLRHVQIPRLDSVVFNAAYGGWSGVNFPQAIYTILTQGLVQSVTWPNFKMALPTCVLNQRPQYSYPAKPLLGEVFTACVFGHYMLAHQLLPLLNRPLAAPTPPGRIVWCSSLEALRDVFALSDMQCFSGKGPYESAKRLTDLLSLTATLPSVTRHSRPFLTPDDSRVAHEKPVPATMYLTHPGIVASTLFPVPWFLMWAYGLAMTISRYLGSPWHVGDSYNGAKSAAWVVLQDQKALDELDAEKIKWGSGSNRHLEVDVKKTEVEGWGWEGRPEDAKALEADGAKGVFRKSQGRKRGAIDVSEEDIVEFEELGAESWKQMEQLRLEWEAALGLTKGSLDEKSE